MKCPFCGFLESKVVDSRPADEGAIIRRRRECLSCAHRFTSYEAVEALPIIVVKRGGGREPFSRQKLLEAMLRAFAKRSVTLETLERAVDSIEQHLQNSREVSSQDLGDLVLDELRGIDEVAYIRFASVYRQFKDVDSFVREIKQMSGD